MVAYWEVKYPFPLSNRDVSFLYGTLFFVSLRVLRSPAAALTLGSTNVTALSWVLTELYANAGASCVTFGESRVFFLGVTT